MARHPRSRKSPTPVREPRVVIRIDASVTVEQLIEAACAGEVQRFGTVSMAARARWLEGIAATKPNWPLKIQALSGALASIGVRVEFVSAAASPEP